MTLYEFKLMDETSQAAMVWYAPHIAERHLGDFSILLFQIDGFYVELYYNNRQNKIDRFRSFSNVDLLTPYLSQIDLNGLFNGK